MHLKKMLLQSSSLKIEFARPKNQKFSIFCLLRENFLRIAKKKKVFYTFLYFIIYKITVKFYKSKYFLRIIVKYFLLFYNFFYTQQVFVFHLLINFCNFTTILSLFYFFFFRKISLSFTLFCSFSLCS